MLDAARKHKVVSLDAPIGRIERSIVDNGSELISLAEQDGTEDVVANPDGRIWINKRGLGWLDTGVTIRPERIGGIVSNMAESRGLLFSESNPTLETDLSLPGSPANGSRVTGVMYPAVNRPMIAIRPHPRGTYTQDEYEDGGGIPEKQEGDYPEDSEITDHQFLKKISGKRRRELIQIAIEDRLNIVLAGATGSGKTTYLNTVIGDIASLTPNDRVVSIEDTYELQLDPLKNHSSLLYTEAFTIERCLKTALRLSPTRIIVGEVRDRAAEYLINAWNTGHSGGIGSIHANSAHDALFRIADMMTDRPNDALHEKIARAVNLVIYMAKDSSVPIGRRIKQIAFVAGYNRETQKYRIIQL